MKNCLLTTLKGSVEDSNLLKLGEIRATYKLAVTTNSVFLTSNTDQQIKIFSGNAKFESTDNNVLDLNSNISTSIKLTDDSEIGSIITIPDKYSLLSLRLNGFTLKAEQIKYIPNLSHLYFSSDDDYDLDFLSNMNNQLTILSFINIGGKAKGDVRHIINAIKQTNDNSVFFSFGEGSLQNITGDVSLFESIAPSLSTCPNFYYTSMYGDISNILNATNTIFSSNNTNINTIIDFDIYNIPPTSPKLNYSRGIIKGDISKLSPLVYGCHGKEGSTCRWSSSSARSSDSYIIGMDYAIDFGDDLDNMLINQANCTVYEDAPEYILSIVALGKRTTASDEAITILQEKGITVDVPKAMS